MTTKLSHEKSLLERTQLGFWLYLMTDCILFASLFATFAVLRTATAGGPSGADIFEMPIVLTETVILLLSSFTSGMALIALKLKSFKFLVSSLVITGLLGAAFLAIELTEFAVLASEGHDWGRSAFLSAFFVLVGTHGLHIFTGLLWLTVLITLLVRRGVSPKLYRQTLLFVLFWHFLDLIWIFVFTIVYLMGVTV